LKKWAEERFVTREHFDAVIKDLKETMATKEDLRQFATKEDLKQLATKEDLKQFATKEDIEKLMSDMKRIEDRMATKEQL